MSKIWMVDKLDLPSSSDKPWWEKVIDLCSNETDEN